MHHAANSRTVPYAVTHTHPFNGPLSGTTQVSRYQKGKTVKPIWILLKQDTVSGSGISCHSTPPLSLLTGRMPFLPPNQQCRSTEGNKH